MRKTAALYFRESSLYLSRTTCNLGFADNISFNEGPTGTLVQEANI